MACILVIDDEELLRGFVADILRRNGHSVLEAGEGGDGIALLGNNSIDLVITDMMMPGMEGLETVGVLHRKYPGLPIIAMSGAIGANAYLQMAKFIGATRMLEKPFTAHQLIELVHTVIEPVRIKAPVLQFRVTSIPEPTVPGVVKTIKRPCIANKATSKKRRI